MNSQEMHAVTGAFGYSGRYIAQRLLQKGHRVVTREEIEGLKADLLYVDAPPAGKTRLTEWARSNAGSLGLHYASELARRRDRRHSYSEIDKGN